MDRTPRAEPTMAQPPRAGLQLAFDADLTLRVENVFDTRIEPVKGFRAPGRTLLAGIRLSHGG